MPAAMRPATAPPAKPASREQALEAMPDEWVTCRAVGHNDRIEGGYGVTVTDATGRRVTYTAWRWVRRVCRSCTREATAYYDQTAMPLASPASRYPDGYLIPGLGRGSPRLEARREWFARQYGTPPAHEVLVEPAPARG